MDNRTADLLIQRVGQGDMSALEELYNSLSRKVYALALSIVRNTAAAEDITQDTFVRIYNAAPDFRANGNGTAWVMRIARNLSINTVRSRAVLSDEVLDSQPALDSAEGKAVDRVIINQALGRLGDTEREVVTLHAVVGLTLGEIAEMLRQPLGTIKWRHAAALKKLRRYLNEMEVDEQWTTRS